MARLFAVSIALALVPGFFAAVCVDASREFREPPRATREYAFVRRHLQQSFAGYSRLDVLAPQFGVVALSHMASGLMNVHVRDSTARDEIAPLAREVVRRAMSREIAPTGRATTSSSAIDSHHLYWSHLAIALGVERAIRCNGSVCPESAEDRLQQRIVETLRGRMLASDDAQIASYPNSPTWPADNAVTLAAFALYDATHATHLAEAPTRAFVRVMQSRRDAATGLFRSAMNRVWYRAIPRGCAASWTTLYLAQVAPDVAREQYERARAHLADDLIGLGGFREWPRHRGGRMDGDSGPIVFGVGMAATGLGLGAARMFGDVDRYTVIRRTASVFGVPSWIPSHGYALAPLLGEAMLFNGRTATPWFGQSIAPIDARPPVPFAPLLFLAIDLAIAAWLAIGIARAVRARREPRPARYAGR